VVLCPDWNDGSFLEKTISDIHQFSPMARTLSIVPVGLTKHREGLPFIAPVTVEYAEKLIPFAQSLDEKYRLKDGRRFVFLSDEWFLVTGQDLPGVGYYEDSDLAENGVGQVPFFWEQWQAGLADLDPQLAEPKTVTVCTGTLVENWFRSHWLSSLDSVDNLNINYIPIQNDFYGKDEVTVSGLLVGQDIVSQLTGKDLGDMVIFSDRILSETGTVTLDDMSLKQISSAIGTPVVVTDDTPVSFFKHLN
jgi:putative radical SAM enzyme (TIGR03279 family)